MTLKTNNLYSPNQEVEKNTNEIHLINPSVTEFKTSYFDEKNVSHEVVLAPLEARAFTHSIGEIILKHLMDFILNQSNFSYRTDVNEELKKIRERCVLYE